MTGLIVLIFAAIHVSLVIYLLRQPSLNAATRAGFLTLLLCAMAYDNLVVGSGMWWFDEAWFASANLPRFYLHVLILPFLTMFTYSLVTAAQPALAQSRLFMVLCAAVTVGALGFGISHELLSIELAEKTLLGLSRYTNANGSLPLATIFTNLFTMLLAIYLWRKSGWPWLCLGALFIFLVNGASAGQPWGFLAGNLAEIVFVFSLIKTHLHFASSGCLSRQAVAL